MTISSEPAWPALGREGWREVDLVAERGIWGKAHGAASDYRWIAASEGIPAGGFGRQLYLGAEDLAESCFLWRALGDGRFLAIAVRPSSATDAAGRSGFLERHVLLLQSSSEAETVLLALAAAAALADWPRLPPSSPEEWRTPDFRQPLAPLRLRCGPAKLQQLAEEGCRELVVLVSHPALAAAYGRLLEGARPAFLTVPSLPAPAVAALLLPLSAGSAAKLSIAGGLPSSRYVKEELGQAWDLVVGATAPPERPPAGDSRSAARLAEALLAATPAGLAAEPIEEFPAKDQQPEREVAPSWLTVIEAFLADPAWRWLSASELPHVGLLEGAWARHLASLAADFAAQPAPEGADGEHWQVKREVVAALLLATAPGECLAGYEPGKRVPALFFALRLGHGDWRRLRQLLGGRFERLAEQSRAVGLALRYFDRSRLTEVDA
jgi:hypothetical protein